MQQKFSEKININRANGIGEKKTKTNLMESHLYKKKGRRKNKNKMRILADARCGNTVERNI